VPGSQERDSGEAERAINSIDWIVVWLDDVSGTWTQGRQDRTAHSVANASLATRLVMQLIQRQLLKSKTVHDQESYGSRKKKTGKASPLSQNRSWRNGNQASLKAGVVSATGFLIAFNTLAS
jgi:hypothetical protein